MKTLIKDMRQETRFGWLAFGLATGIFLLTVLPILLFEKGYFIYYGDFNSQQLPFYTLAHDAVRSGSFGWNWTTDLGADFIGSYAFYLLGSPFFWVTTLFPRSLSPHLIPILLAVKHGVAALTAYHYIRRFVRSPRAALVGGLLYAFSGFQLFNIFFNHFHDVTAFFPLMLIAMEELVNHNRRGVFALSVALMAMLSYFFFAGQAVFLVLYFIFRCFAPDFRANARKFLSVGIEALIGTAMGCLLLVPSALAILANDRVSQHLYGMDILAYSDTTRIWRILWGLFVLPDAPARPNLFSSNHAKWASIGGYLPLFSMAGVIAFMQQKKGHWAKQLVALCALCACIPVLNSMFYAFNGAYYARWFYMPILLLALMTAYALDNPAIEWRTGFLISGGMMAVLGLTALLPVKKDERSKVTLWFNQLEHPWFFLFEVLFCLAMLVLCGILLWLIRKKKLKAPVFIGILTAVCIACNASMIYFGAFERDRALAYIDQAVDTDHEITAEVTPDNFFRVDISPSHDNYTMFWRLPNMRCFHSVVPVSIMDFYDAIEETRDVASRIDTKIYTLRGLFSVKYYYQQIEAGKEADEMPPAKMPGFTYEKTENGFYRYVNQAYVPMGFRYDYYLPELLWRSMTKEERSQVLMRAVILDKEQIERYNGILQPLPADDRTVTEEDYLNDCAARAATACDTFHYDSSGFTATCTSDQTDLVFFSVPYSEGWTAQVNGTAVPVEKVDAGFIAIPVQPGQNTITVTYHTPGLRLGAALCTGGAAAWCVYMLVTGRRRKKEYVSCCDYEEEGF